MSLVRACSIIEDPSTRRELIRKWKDNISLEDLIKLSDLFPSGEEKLWLFGHIPEKMPPGWSNVVRNIGNQTIRYSAVFHMLISTHKLDPIYTHLESFLDILSLFDSSTRVDLIRDVMIHLPNQKYKCSDVATIISGFGNLLNRYRALDLMRERITDLHKNFPCLLQGFDGDPQRKIEAMELLLSTSPPCPGIPFEYDNTPDYPQSTKLCFHCNKPCEGSICHIPCGHIILCKFCAWISKNSPIPTCSKCKQRIQHFIRVFS